LGKKDSPDVESVSRDPALNSSDYERAILYVENDEIERSAKTVSNLVNVSNLSHFEDCVAFWLIGEKTRNLDKINYVLSANGPDELFCGYDRFRRILDSSGDGSVANEILVALKSAENLGSQVELVLSHFGLKIFEPFLTEGFKHAGLSIPVEYKILKGNDLLRKRVWRCYGRFLKLDEAIIRRPKKAMQYGMGLHQVVRGMLKRGILELEVHEKTKESRN
jgi:asparagine synthase (glutamine-hydrolysing)